MCEAPIVELDEHIINCIFIITIINGFILIVYVHDSDNIYTR